MTKPCKKCGSVNIVKEEGMGTYCDDCGFIQNQKEAKRLYEEEQHGYEFEEDNDDKFKKALRK
jgi:transcription initiation factor TFIIIB Brf1 subunit/transcription initiation factor TFIIB